MKLVSSENTKCCNGELFIEIFHSDDKTQWAPRIRFILHSGQEISFIADHCVGTLEDGIKLTKEIGHICSIAGSNLREIYRGSHATNQNTH